MHLVAAIWVDDELFALTGVQVYLITECHWVYIEHLSTWTTEAEDQHMQI